MVNLEKMVDTELRLKCKIYYKSFSSLYNLKQHELLHKQIRVVCELCGSDFSSKSNLASHKRRKHSVSSVGQNTIESHSKDDYMCKYCGDRFGSERDAAYDAHLKKHFLKDVQFERKPLYKDKTGKLLEYSPNKF